VPELTPETVSEVGFGTEERMVRPGALLVGIVSLRDTFLVAIQGTGGGIEIEPERRERTR